MALIAAIGLLIFKSEALHKYIRDTWEGIKMIFNKGIETISKSWTAFWVGIYNWAKTQWDRVILYFKNAWGSIKGIFKDAYDYIMNLLNPLINAFNRVMSMARSVGSMVGSGISKIGHAVGLASGGIVTRPTLAMIGEGGSPEAVIPLNKLNSFGNITVNINGGNYLSEEAAEQMGDLIIEKLKLQMKL